MKRGVWGTLWLDGAFIEGWLTWQRGRLVEVGRGRPAKALRAELYDCSGQRLVPGFVDTLLHGYAGVGASVTGAAGLFPLAQALAQAGVTSLYAGFYPWPGAKLRRAATAWSGYAARLDRQPRARLLGWHLEGPFLDPAMAGALPPEAMQEASAAAAVSLLRDCGGWLRLCTLGPELPGALEAAMTLADAGVLPCIGHTRASYQDCAALAAVCEVGITHLGNRCLPLSAREPGPIGFALGGGADWVGVIPDGVHVAPEVLELFARHPELEERLMFQSDNLSHAGLPAADFLAGGKRLHRDGPAARDESGGLAGTLDPLPVLLLERVRDGSLSWEQALRGGCEVPGRLAGDCGRLASGLRADLAALDAGGRVAQVWVGGKLVSAG